MTSESPRVPPLLDPESAAALGRGIDLATVARALADAAVSGRHRAGGRGGTSEFYDFRPYTLGDSPRLVDWRLAARTDRLYLRRFRQEGRLSLVCVVDASASMDFGGMNRPRAATKFRRAREVAAALAYVAIKRGDAAGLVIAGRSRCDAIPPRAGWPALHECVAALEAATCDPQAGSRERANAQTKDVDPLVRGMNAAGTLLPRGGLVVGLSDGLDDVRGTLDAAARLRMGHGAGSSLIGGSFGGAGARDVRIVQILTHEELELPAAIAARLIDPETGISADAGDDSASAYNRAIARHIDELRAGLLRLGASHHLCGTQSDSVDVLRELLGR